LVTEAAELKSRSDAQESANRSHGAHSGYADYQEPDHGFTRANNGSTPSRLADFDPNQTVAKIYPILRFRDKVVRMLTSVIEKIPGLEAL
ncbi:HET-C domain protein, partial [Aspergillus sclerotialis]